MKKIFPPLFLSLFCFMQCKKDKTSLNIVLYNKPLATIQFYIQGRWKMEYEYGGICSVCTNPFHDKDYVWQFSSNNNVTQFYNGARLTDTTITWVWDAGMYLGKDSTFIMQFYDKRQYPYNYVVDGIFNDSLQLHDNGSDPVYYHFSKIN